MVSSAHQLKVCSQTVFVVPLRALQCLCNGTNVQSLGIGTFNSIRYNLLFRYE